jgi:hypothetical protein
MQHFSQIAAVTADSADKPAPSGGLILSLQ